MWRFVDVTKYVGYHVEVTNIRFVEVTKHMWGTVGLNNNHSTNIQFVPLATEPGISLIIF